MKNVFFTDLDNTLIYSYKQEMKEEKLCVEIYQGREISFMTKMTQRNLCSLQKSWGIVPTTTRTMEQYARIDLGIGHLPYSLVCNGGILLIDNMPDAEWLKESRHFIEPAREALEKGIMLLEKDVRREFELRFVDELFVFTKVSEPQKVAEELREVLDGDTVDILHTGKKLYIHPKNLSKGIAVKRFCERFSVDYSISAGDSAFDISMLVQTDQGFVPKGVFANEVPHTVTEIEQELRFSEEMTKKLLCKKNTN